MSPKDKITETFIINLKYYMDMDEVEDLSFLKGYGISERTIKYSITSKTSIGNMQPYRIYCICHALRVPISDMLTPNANRIDRTLHKLSYIYEHADEEQKNRWINN